MTPSLDQQRSFFNTFGFLKLPGLFADAVQELTRDFEQVFVQKGIAHDRTHRTAIVPFIDESPALCKLLDHPKIVEAITNLVGSDFNYMGSDGNYYVGDTTWHRDGFAPSDSFIKLAFYLDPVRSDTGCLRVIPGSHTDAAMSLMEETVLRDSDRRWRLGQGELPAVPLESDPGDVLIFKHRLLHASFGGSNERRMFTINAGRRAQTKQEIDDLIEYGDIHFRRNNMTAPYGRAMLETASPERMAHLTQLTAYWPASVARHEARMASGG